MKYTHKSVMYHSELFLSLYFISPATTNIYLNVICSAGSCECWVRICISKLGPLNLRERKMKSPLELFIALPIDRI